MARVILGQTRLQILSPEEFEAGRRGLGPSARTCGSSTSASSRELPTAEDDRGDADRRAVRRRGAAGADPRIVGAIAPPGRACTSSSACSSRRWRTRRAARRACPRTCPCAAPRSGREWRGVAALALRERLPAALARAAACSAAALELAFELPRSGRDRDSRPRPPTSSLPDTGPDLPGHPAARARAIAATSPTRSPIV